LNKKKYKIYQEKNSLFVKFLKETSLKLLKMLLRNYIVNNQIIDFEEWLKDQLRFIKKLLNLSILLLNLLKTLIILNQIDLKKTSLKEKTNHPSRQAFTHQSLNLNPNPFLSKRLSRRIDKRHMSANYLQMWRLC